MIGQQCTYSFTNYSAGSYRFGFNGFEKDDEVEGSGNHLSFGDYGYDPRIVRRWIPEPLEKKYPSLSTYCVFNNNPIIYHDVNGLDWEIKTTIDNDGNKTIHIKLTAAVLNSSSQNIDMNKFKATVETQVKNTYSTSWKEATKWKTVNLNAGLDRPANNMTIPVEYRNVNVEVETDVRVINDKSELKNTEHLIQILIILTVK